MPSEWQGRPTEFGMQQGRDTVIPGALQPDGTTHHDTEVTAYTDAKGRLRYRGPCVHGRPEEPFVYLSWRVIGDVAWVMRAKAMLPLEEDFVSALPEGAVLQTSVRRMGHRDAGQVQEWAVV